VRFLVDMPLSPALASWLSEQGHDAIHARDRGLDRTSDQEIFEYALKEKRIIITADLDYPRIFILAKTGEPGLILFRGGNYSEKEACSRLKQALEKIEEKDFYNSIVVIEKTRIRRRPLM